MLVKRLLVFPQHFPVDESNVSERTVSCVFYDTQPLVVCQIFCMPVRTHCRVVYQFGIKEKYKIVFVLERNAFGSHIPAFDTFHVMRCHPAASETVDEIDTFFTIFVGIEGIESFDKHFIV